MCDTFTSGMTSGRFFLVTLGAALLVASSAGDALARRKPRGVFHVIINGKTMKPTRPVELVLSPYELLTLSVSRFPNHGRALQRGLIIDCDVTGQTLPATTSCHGYYSVEKYGVPTSLRQYNGRVTLAVDVYDGEHATGHFGGVLGNPTHGGTPPAVVEGFFSVPMSPWNPY